MAACLLPAGCGSGRPKRVPVSGRVLIDGQPLSTGFIRLVPEKARPCYAQLDADGRFRLTTFDEGDGCVLGAHRVEVIAYKTLSLTETLWLTPVKYRDADTSGLTVTINGPNDSLEIAISWEGGQPWVERLDTSGDVDPAKLQ